MKRTRTQRGITLIALIITIVILLIIAIVSIGAIENSKIIAHAQNATTDYDTKKKEEESKLSQYESLIDEAINGKITKEYAVYGTEAVYVICSENEAILVENSFILGEDKVPQKMNIIRKGKEEYLSELSPEEADSKRTDIEEVEASVGASVSELIFLDSGELVAATLEDKLYIVSDGSTLDSNEELAKKVVLKKGTYQCYVMFDEKGDGGLYLVQPDLNIGTMYAYSESLNASTGSMPYDKFEISENNDEIEIEVFKDVGETEKVILGTEAKKVETILIGQNNINVYYIQDSILYMSGDMTSVENGDRCISFQLIDFDVSKLGSVVVTE